MERSLSQSSPIPYQLEFGQHFKVVWSINPWWPSILGQVNVHSATNNVWFSGCSRVYANRSEKLEPILEQNIFNIDRSSALKRPNKSIRSAWIQSSSSDLPSTFTIILVYNSHYPLCLGSNMYSCARKRLWKAISSPKQTNYAQSLWISSNPLMLGSWGWNG